MKAGERKRQVLGVLQGYSELLILIILGDAALAPLGVFALLTKLMATQDMELLKPWVSLFC